MKTPFKPLARLLATLCALVLPTALLAQETETKPLGFIRLANAVAQGTGPLQFLINGEIMNPDGYQLGDATGGIGLPPGSHTVTVRRDGVTEGTTKINLVADETTTVIPFAERIPASDEEKAHWQIRVLRLKQKEPDNGRTATFVSVAAEPEIAVELSTPNNTWLQTRVKRLGTAELPIQYPEGYATIRHKNEKIGAIPVGNVGNYVVVLYSDEEGALHTLQFRDFKFLSAD
jgi:hypothetical protein